MDFVGVIDNENGDIIRIGLLEGGEHFDEIQGRRRGANTRATRTQRYQINTHKMPQTIMLRHVVEQDIHQSQPI